MEGGKKGGRRRGGALVAERVHRFYAVTSKPFQAAVVKCPKAKYLPKIALTSNRNDRVSVYAIGKTKTYSESAFQDLFSLFCVKKILKCTKIK